MTEHFKVKLEVTNYKHSANPVTGDRFADARMSGYRLQAVGLHTAASPALRHSSRHPVKYSQRGIEYNDQQ